MIEDVEDPPYEMSCWACSFRSFCSCSASSSLSPFPMNQIHRGLIMSEFWQPLWYSQVRIRTITNLWKQQLDGAVSFMVYFIPGVLQASFPDPTSQFFIEKPVNQTVNEGQDILLKCKVGNLQGRVQWTRNGFAMGKIRWCSWFWWSVGKVSTWLGQQGIAGKKSGQSGGKGHLRSIKGIVVGIRQQRSIGVPSTDILRSLPSFNEVDINRSHSRHGWNPFLTSSTPF